MAGLLTFIYYNISIYKLCNLFLIVCTPNTVLYHTCVRRNLQQLISILAILLHSVFSIYYDSGANRFQSFLHRFCFVLRYFLFDHYWCWFHKFLCLKCIIVEIITSICKFMYKVPVMLLSYLWNFPKQNDRKVRLLMRCLVGNLSSYTSWWVPNSISHPNRVRFSFACFMKDFSKRWS